MQQPQNLQFRGLEAQRLDLFLTAEFAANGYIRSYWRHMIDGGYVQVNDATVKAGHKLKQGDKIFIKWPVIDVSFRDKVDIIFENHDVLVLNKPAGMLVHSKGSFNPEFTIADFIADKVAISHNKTEANQRAGIVHRLDRHTSGVLIVGRNQEAVSFLQNQFAERRVRKHYQAVVHGRLDQDKLRIDIPIERDPANPKQMTVSAHGKAARTDITVHRYSAEQDMSCLNLYPHTGRTHQLRVHLAHIGHPIVGDTHYGSRTQLQDDRFLLHAHALTLTLPHTSSADTFIATMPTDMASYWDE